MKRFFAAVMTVVMLLNTLPLAAFAMVSDEPAAAVQSGPAAKSEYSDISLAGLSKQPSAAMLTQRNTQTISDDQNLTMSATNSLSALMLAGMKENLDAENNGSDAEHYRITNITVAGQTAQVDFIADGPADLVVGVYSTDEKQLLTSGTQRVDKTDPNGTVSVVFAGTLPKYFVVKGYLLDTDEHFALSDGYVNTLFTEEMVSLAEATVDDFDPNLVINLDDQADTNFGVVKEDVVLLENDPATETENIIVQDGDSYIYTVENPTEEFADLQEGETFVYHGPGGLLVAKVKDIREEGDRLIITGDDQLDIRDVFDVLKIDSDQESEAFHYVEGSIDGNVTVEEPHEVDFAPQAPESITGEASVDEDNGMAEDLTEQIQNMFTPKTDKQTKEAAISIHVEKEYKQEYTDDLNYSVRVKIDSDLAVSANFAYYIAFDRVYVATTAELNMRGVYGIDAQLKTNLDLGDYSATDTMTGVSIGLTAGIDIDVTANATVTLLTTAIVGGSYQLGYGFKNLSQNPYYQMTADAEVVVKAVLHLSPFVGASYGLVRLYLNLDFTAILTAHANFRQVDSEFMLDSREGCSPVCFAFNMHITCSGDLQIKLRFLMEKDDVAFEPLKLWENAVLIDGDAYWSPSREEFAFSKCPHTEYRVTAALDGVNNTTSLPLYLQKNGNTPELFDECTYVNPTKFYLEGGNYRIISVVDGCVFATDEFTLDKAMEVTLIKHPEIDLNELLNSGYIDDGKEESHITYTYNEKTRTLIISGEGKMPSFDTANGGISCPWPVWEIERLIIREGVTTAGNSAFENSNNLTTIYLPKSLISVDNEAFDSSRNIQNIYYAGTVKEWRKVYKSREQGNFCLARVHCSDGELNPPMAGGNGSEENPFQISTVAQLESIQDKPYDLYYVLINDIDLAGIEWEPLNCFRGVLDGQNHSIRNMTITQFPDPEENDYGGHFYSIGLFKSIDWRYIRNWSTASAQIENLNLEDINISLDGADQPEEYSLAVGALVAKTTNYSLGSGNGDFSNCTVSGRISIKNADVTIGGLVGSAAREHCAINRCTSNLEIQVENAEGYVGSLSGSCGYLYNCTSNSKITLINSPNLICNGIVGSPKYSSLVYGYNVSDCTDNSTVIRK